MKLLDIKEKQVLSVHVFKVRYSLRNIISNLFFFSPFFLPLSITKGLTQSDQQQQQKSPILLPVIFHIIHKNKIQLYKKNKPFIDMHIYIKKKKQDFNAS